MNTKLTVKRYICGKWHTWTMLAKGGYLRHNGSQPCGNSIWAGGLGATTMWRAMSQQEFEEYIDEEISESYERRGDEWRGRAEVGASLRAYGCTGIRANEYWEV